MKMAPASESFAARVLIAAGGTGGHVFPAMAVAEALRKHGLGISWLGTEHGLEAERVPAAGIEFHTLPVKGLRGRGVLGLLVAPFVILRAMLGALRIIRSIRPNLVLGMGGYASGPTGLVARFSGIPLAIHEQNAVPGLTNRLLAPIASRVMEAFRGSFAASVGAVHTGNPLRESFTRDATEHRELAATSKVREAGSGGAACRILVLGGSQGALALNEVLPATLSVLSRSHDVSVWHQTGPAHLDVTVDAYRQLHLDVRAEAFIEDMPAAYGWADLVVCRAGAMTIAELAYVGVAAVLVPYPFAVDDHQRANASYLVESGAAVLVNQPELADGGLARVIGELLNDRARLSRMAGAAQRLGMGDAAERVALQCLELVDV